LDPVSRVHNAVRFEVFVAHAPTKTIVWSYLVWIVAESVAHSIEDDGASRLTLHRIPHEIEEIV